MKPKLFRTLTYSVILLFCVTSFQVGQTSVSLSAVWMDLFAEFVGVGFTVLIIEHFLALEKRTHARPARYAAYLAIYEIHRSCIFLWSQMIESAIDLEKHKLLFDREEIPLLDERFGRCVADLNLQDLAPGSPLRRWDEYLTYKSEGIRNEIDRAMQRYTMFMEPEEIQILHELERDSLFKFIDTIPNFSELPEEANVCLYNRMMWGKDGEAENFVGLIQQLGTYLKNDYHSFKGLKGMPESIRDNPKFHLTEFIDKMNNPNRRRSWS